MKITGIILAGGKSSRMGTDKGLMEFNGKALIQWVIDAIHPIVDETIIVTNQHGYDSFNATIVADEVKDKGPLAGICTGLKESSSQTNIIVSCDTPFLTSDLFEWILLNHKAEGITVLKEEQQVHPLIGVYSKNTLHTLKNALDANELKLRLAFEKTPYQLLNICDYPDYNAQITQNLNTIEELNALR